MKEKNKVIDECKTINIKVQNKEQVISQFSYDENDKINKDLAEFIESKSKDVRFSQDIQLNFYSKQEINADEIQPTISNHFRAECKQAKDELKVSNIAVIVLMILGVIGLACLLWVNRFFDNFFFQMILEIASWVFIWEAVNVLFLQRPKLRRKFILMQKLSNANVNVVVEK